MSGGRWPHRENARGEIGEGKGGRSLGEIAEIKRSKILTR